MAYRAKQNALKKREYDKGMEKVKRGKHFLARQPMRESERIKHIKAFLAELRQQKHLLETKDETIAEEARLIEQEKL